MDKPNTVYVTFIGSTREHIWNLLIDPDTCPGWFVGNRVEVGSAVGDRFCVIRPDGSIEVDGEVLAIEPGRCLRICWTMPDLPVSPLDNEIEFIVEDKGQGVLRVAIQEYFHNPMPQHWIEAAREAWSLILASLKTLAETGKRLPTVKLEPPE